MFKGTQNAGTNNRVFRHDDHEIWGEIPPNKTKIHYSSKDGWRSATLSAELAAASVMANPLGFSILLLLFESDEEDIEISRGLLEGMPEASTSDQRVGLRMYLVWTIVAKLS